MGVMSKIESIAVVDMMPILSSATDYAISGDGLVWSWPRRDLL